MFVQYVRCAPPIFIAWLARRARRALRSRRSTSSPRMSRASTPRPIAVSSVMHSSPPRCSRNSPARRAARACPARRATRQAQRSSSSTIGGPVRLAEQPGLDRVARVERQPIRDRLAVAQRVVGQDLELVRRPVAEVERPRVAMLERIAAGRDVREVELGAAPDQRLRPGALSNAASAARSATSQRNNPASRTSATFTASAIPAGASRGRAWRGTGCR